MTEKKQTKTRAEQAEGFTPEERAAMKERAQEVKRARRGSKADGESDLLAKIARCRRRSEAGRAHPPIVTQSAPSLQPRTWYGMPAYAKDGKVLCFFQSAAKFKARYATFGFNDVATLDDGAMWPTAFALTALTKRRRRRSPASCASGGRAPLSRS